MKALVEVMRDAATKGGNLDLEMRVKNAEHEKLRTSHLELVCVPLNELRYFELNIEKLASDYKRRPPGSDGKVGCDDNASSFVVCQVG